MILLLSALTFTAALHSLSIVDILIVTMGVELVIYIALYTSF